MRRAGHTEGGRAVSAYWYAVNDATKEHVFVVAQNHRPTDEWIVAWLRALGLAWEAPRLVSDEEDELWDVIDKTYREIDL